MHRSFVAPFAVAAKVAGAASLLTLLAATAGCPAGKCWVRLQQVDESGNVQKDECLVDTCPKNGSFDDKAQACACKQGFVTFGGACKTVAEANASCAKGYQYSNGACVAIACPAGQVLNASTGACENKAASDAAVAASSGVSIGAGQTIGCPAGQTYVVNGHDGACVPNELTCGEGTKYQGGTCVATNCPAGTVYDNASQQCQKIGNDSSSFSVQVKLNSEMGPQFCAPHSKNPAGFGVQPGGSMTINVSVTVSVPSNNIEQTALGSMRVTNVGGAELTPAVYPEVANVQKHVQEGVIGDIRALGGKSIETQATATVQCVIKRAPIQVVETKGGGV
jgi:hypothetical protein